MFSINSKYSNLFQTVLPQLNQARYLRKWTGLKLAPPRIPKRLDIVLFGLPNAGKSVLLNRLIKYKLAATSRKRHTTRDEILGVFNHRNTQLAFYDTPGFITSADTLKEEVKILRNSPVDIMEKADVTLLVVDAVRKIDTYAQYCFGEMVKIALRKSAKEVILVLNKVDLVNPKKKLLEISKTYVALYNGVKYGIEKMVDSELAPEVFMISGLKDDGVIDLKNYLIRRADKKEWLLQGNTFTTLSVEKRVEEILTEKILDYFHEEIPYRTKVECTKIVPDEHDPEAVHVECLVEVENERYKKMLIGALGRNISILKVGLAEDLEKIFNKPVSSSINVKNINESLGQI
jgi:GTP-binding protein Era